MHTYEDLTLSEAAFNECNISSRRATLRRGVLLVRCARRTTLNADDADVRGEMWTGEDCKFDIKTSIFTHVRPASSVTVGRKSVLATSGYIFFSLFSI